MTGSPISALVEVGQRSFETRSEVSDALLLGAPVVFMVIAVTAMCCVILLRWKMQDRLRRRQYDNIASESNSWSPERRPIEGATQ